MSIYSKEEIGAILTLHYANTRMQFRAIGLIIRTDIICLFACFVDLLPYVHGKQLRSCRNGRLS